MAVSFDIVEHEHGARAWWERRDRLLQVDPGLRIVWQRDPGYLGSIQLCSGLFVILIVRQHYPRAPTTVRPCFDEHLVHGDPVQP